MPDAATQIDFTSSDPLGAGRLAFSNHRWHDAFDLLTAADAQTPLSGPDLESLAVAAFFAGRAETRTDILERAFKAYLAADDQMRAAYLAIELCRNFALRGRPSVASGWFRRAERILEGQPESYAHGYLAFARSELAREAGQVEAAMDLAAQASAIAGRAGDADLQAYAAAQLALLKIATGSTTEGIALLEEAAIAAVNGELTPLVAGITACSMIAACRDLTDYRRASEWIEMTDKWCESQAVGGFPGVCRVHRAEVVALTGGWQRAEEELRKATVELEAYQAVPVIADGLYAIGEIHRLQGDFDGAEEILRQAHAMGRSPQPALALLRLGSGKVKSATAAIEAALGETTWDVVARGRLLAAKVEIELAAGEVAVAREAVDELATAIASDAPPALRGGLAHALGRVLLAEDDVPSAIHELRRSIGLWREVGSRYEIARVRAALSGALRRAGNEDDADLELRAARDEFERLGAKPDLAVADQALRELEARRATGSQVRMAFLFTDIVGSTKLAEALGDGAWEKLLGWHDDMLRTQVGRHGGRIVNWTGDGIFAAFGSTRPALQGAIAIQRALAAHADSTGFAPPVRIGVHRADATQRGDDFSGIGVHVAARIAALAGGGEILVSGDALADAPDVTAGDAREVEVRGVSMPVRVATLPWS